MRRSQSKAELKAVGRQLHEVAEHAEEGRAAAAMELDKAKAQLTTEVSLFQSKFSGFSSRAGWVVGSGIF